MFWKLGMQFSRKRDKKHMDINAHIRTELATSIASLSIEAAIYKANFQKEASEHEATKQQLARLQSVLDSNEDLKSSKLLFSCFMFASFFLKMDIW